MNPVQMSFPGKIAVGPGCSSQWMDICAQAGKKKVLVLSTDPIWGAIQPQIEEAAQRKLKVKTLSYSWPGEPTTEYFETLRREALSFGPDAVVGVGGGSVLDVAKLLAALSERSQHVEKFFGNGLIKARKLQLICIPTTSGTGSEVSPNAILLDSADGEKKGIISPYLLPDATLVDADLTMTLPAKITAETGMDALCHCIEAYMNVNANPVTDTFALRGIVLIYKNLLKAVKDGRNRPAREAMAIASMMGGLCLGPVNTCGVHALSYGLAGKYHLPHGLANALLLPAVMTFNRPSSAGRFARMAKAMGLSLTGDTQTDADRCIEAIGALSADCGIPQHLSEVGIREEDIPVMADMAMNVKRLLVNNPREITRDDAIAIYQQIY